MAVSGDAAGADSAEGDGTGVAGTRHRPLETPSVSPWLPQQLWKCVAVVSLFWLTLSVCGVLLARPTWLPEPVARVLLPMLLGTSPRLALYLDVALWILAAELAGVIGWYRSHSQLDFSGRYRVWGWIVFSFLTAGFLAATRLHETLALEYLANSPYLTWRRETVAWLAPLLLWGGLTGWLIDRDVRRCLASLILLRMAAVTFLALAAGYLWAPELSCEAWFVGAMLAGRLLATGLLATALWRQACYVAYVCPDPPEKTLKAANTSFLSALLRRWWTPKEAAETETAKPTRRRRKAADETDGEESTTPKRRRKPATKARKPAKRRTKPEPEEAEYDEEAAEEAEDENWETASEDESSSDDGSEWSDGDELAQLEALTRPESPSRESKSGTSSKAASQQTWQESDDDENDGDYGGVDDGHSGADLYKGLSKRQRRELKKQQREQTRDR